MRVFVLKKHNGEDAVWSEITLSEIDKWLEDGSLDEGDMIVHVKETNVYEIESKKILIKKRRTEI